MKNLFVGIKRSRIFFDLFFSILISIMNCLFTHVMSMSVRYFVDEVFLQYIIIVFIVQLVFAVSEFTYSWYGTLTSCHIENGAYSYYLRKLYDVKPEVLRKNNTGYLSGLLNKLVIRQSDAYSCVVRGLIVDVCYILYFAVILSQLSWKISLVALCTTMSGAVLRAIIKNRLMPLGGRVADAEGVRTKVFTDSVSNIETVQKMNAIDFIESSASVANADCVKVWSRWAVFDECSNALGKLITFAFGPMCLVVMYFMDKDFLLENLSLVALISSVSTQIPHNAKSFARTVSACSKFRDVASKLESVVEENNSRKEIVPGLFVSATISGAIHEYRDESRGVNITVNIPDFVLHKGDRICITGESGQGKTTLLNILSGNIESGRVVINGYTNRRLDCVFIAQDVEIFDMSLRENLCMGRDVPDAVLSEMIKAVGMWDWFEQAGKNFDIPLGERGVFVSTGQRQRLNLCRGLLAKDKEVYLLDEPTSNVDEDTERLMVDLLDRYLDGKTVVIVTHRSALKRICDYEYRFENGILGERTVL